MSLAGYLKLQEGKGPHGFRLHNGDDFRGRVKTVYHGYAEIEDEEGGVLYVDTDSIVIAVPDKEGGK
jgi:hypothetical protein